MAESAESNEGKVLFVSEELLIANLFAVKNLKGKISPLVAFDGTSASEKGRGVFVCVCVCVCVCMCVCVCTRAE